MRPLGSTGWSGRTSTIFRIDVSSWWIRARVELVRSQSCRWCQLRDIHNRLDALGASAKLYEERCYGFPGSGRAPSHTCIPLDLSKMERMKVTSGIGKDAVRE